VNPLTKLLYVSYWRYRFPFDNSLKVFEKRVFFPSYQSMGINKLMSVTNVNFIYLKGAQAGYKNASSWRPTNDPWYEIFLIQSFDDTMVIFAHTRSSRQHERCPSKRLPSFLEPLHLFIIKFSQILVFQAAPLILIQKLYTSYNLILILFNILFSTSQHNLIKFRVRNPPKVFHQILSQLEHEPIDIFPLA